MRGPPKFGAIQDHHENVNALEFKASIEHLLKSEGITLLDLERTCSEIVVFGSRALGLARDDSDIDLLCIGQGQSLRRRSLDLIFRTSAFVHSPRWLSSELGTHVARYGVWIHGRSDWANDAIPDAGAAERKRQLIAARSRALRRLWDSLLPVYRQKHTLKLRRDLQRLQFLEKGLPVPPTAMLDQAWEANPGDVAPCRITRA